MAEQWIAFRPRYGKAGTGTFQMAPYGSEKYSGRLQRRGVARVSSRQNPDVYRDIPVTQIGLGNLFEPGSLEFFLTAAGGRARFEFKSNTKYFRLSDDNDELVPLSKFLVFINNVSVKPLSINTRYGIIYEMSGDPGALAMYDMAIAISVPSNPGFTDKVYYYYIEMVDDELTGAEYREELTAIVRASV